MTAKLVIENLKHRPMRSLLSILLISVPVTLILTLVGMTHGMLEDAQMRARGSGADVVIKGPTAASISTYSGAAVDERYIPKFQEQPHVAVATGVYIHNIEVILPMMGIDLDGVNKLTGGLKFEHGQGFQGPDDMIVDTYYANQNHLQVGSTHKLLNHEWRVCGIVDPGKLVRVAVPRKTLQDMDDIHGMVTVVYIKADDPANADLLKKELGDKYQNFSVFTMEEIVSQLTDASPALGPLRIFTQVVIGIGVVIAFAVVCLAQYMAVLQRTREIGILKSLGAGKTFVLSIVLIEALALGIGGSILGVLTSFGAQWVIARLVPASIQMAIVYEWWPRSLAIILVAALLGSLYPGLSAASHDPIEALAYE